MSDRETHPPDSLLLLHLDGELGGRRAAVFRRHLSDCWPCRARYEALKQRACEFAAQRQGAFTPGPPAVASSRRFAARLLAEEEGSAARRPMFAFSRRAAWLTSALSAALAGILLAIAFTRPPSLSAAEFLRQVQSAEARPAPRVAVVQRVRLRQGTRSIERDVRRGIRREAPAPAEPEWRSTLGAVSVEWDDPLNATSFVRWQRRQGEVRYQVREGSEEITLITAFRDAALVRSASLVVRRADWRPIAKRFEFTDRPPLEISELAYHVDPAVEAPPVPSTVTAAPRDAAPAPIPAAADLERAEIGAREILHALGADRREAIEIVRGAAVIEVRATTETEERRNALAAALSGAPLVRSKIQTLAEAAASGANGEKWVEIAAPPAYSSDPPFARALWSLMGGMDEANGYLELARSHYGRARSSVMALDRLARRYNGAAWDSLPGDVRARVNRLAGDLIAAIEKDGREYLALIVPPLNQLQGANAAKPAEAAVERGCGDWRTAPLAADLEETQASFRKLFVVEESSQPASELGPELMRRHLESRRRLTLALEVLCSPEAGR